jgi:hypothetical protein
MQKPVLMPSEQGGTMTPNEIEMAWRLMSMHNSELLLENAELRKRLDAMNNISVRRILWHRLCNLFRRNT